MAYKVQIGAANLGGSLNPTAVTSSLGLDAGDKDITNVNAIHLDEIKADGTAITISMTDNQSQSLKFMEGSNTYVRFDTSDGAELVNFEKPLLMSGAVQVQFNSNVDTLGINPESGALRLSGSAGLQLEAVDGVSIVGLFKMPDNTSGKLLVADGTSFEEVALSGDATIASNGALTIANNAITQAKMADDAIGADELAANAVVNASVAAGAAIAFSKMEDVTDGRIIVGNGSNVPTAVAVSGDATLANNGAVTLASAQTNISSVKHDSLVIGRATGNDDITFSDDTIDLMTNDVSRLKVETAQTTVSNNLIIAGNLTVQGSATEVQQGFVVTSSVKFEGIVPDGFETELIAVNQAGADRTITLPDLDGHVPLLVGAISTANVTAGEFALLDGDSTIGTTTLDKDHGFLHNDGGTMKQTKISEISDFLVSDGLTQNANKGLEVSLNSVGATKTVPVSADIIAIVDSTDNITKKMTFTNFKSGISAEDVALKDDGGVLAPGVNYFANLGGAEAVTLPLGSSYSVGTSVRVKAPSNCSVTNTLTINRSGSNTIDGANSVVIQSPHGALEMVYVSGSDGNLWKIF